MDIHNDLMTPREGDDSTETTAVRWYPPPTRPVPPMPNPPPRDGDEYKTFEMPVDVAAANAERDAFRARVAELEAERDAAKAEAAARVKQNETQIRIHSQNTREWKDALDKAKADLEAARAGEARAVEALKSLHGMIDEVINHCGRQVGDDLKDAMDKIEGAIYAHELGATADWLAQQRSEAAEAERNANTDTVRSMGPHFCDFLFSGVGESEYLRNQLAAACREAATEARAEAARLREALEKCRDWSSKSLDLVTCTGPWDLEVYQHCLRILSVKPSALRWLEAREKRAAAEALEEEANVLEKFANRTDAISGEWYQGRSYTFREVAGDIRDKVAALRSAAQEEPHAS